jgi:predicted amino acid racemase
LEMILTLHELSAPTATVLRKTNGTEIPAVDEAGIGHNFFQGASYA